MIFWRLLQQGYDNAAIGAHEAQRQDSGKPPDTSVPAVGVNSRLEPWPTCAHPGVLGVIGGAAQSDRFVAAEDNSLRVLLVDDNARYRTQLRRMMGKAYKQSSSTSGLHEEAVPWRGSTRFTGWETWCWAHGEQRHPRCTRRLRALYPQVRVVLISAYPDREFHHQGLEAGAVAPRQKDLDVATLP